MNAYCGGIALGVNTVSRLQSGDSTLSRGHRLAMSALAEKLELRKPYSAVRSAAEDSKWIISSYSRV